MTHIDLARGDPGRHLGQWAFKLRLRREAQYIKQGQRRARSSDLFRARECILPACFANSGLR